MKRALIVVALVALAGCSSETNEPQAGTSATIEVQTPTAAPSTVAPASPTPVATSAAPVTPSASTSSPKPQQTGAGDVSFCDYLAKTADASQQVESPDEYVALVKGAVAVAPGAISQDVALFATSVEKLALTVTGTPAQAAKADAWLSRNEAAVQQAQDNLNSYSLSTCGQPFVTGEGN